MRSIDSPQEWVERSDTWALSGRAGHDGFREVLNPSYELRRPAHGVIHQRLAERTDRAGDLVAGGNHGIEGFFDPAAIFLGDGQRRQQWLPTRRCKRRIALFLIRIWCP
jgi:hypothetical protein